MNTEWTIQALERDLPRALASCNNQFERDNVKAFHGMEIRELASNLKAQGRLTPGGRAIAEEYGWRA